MPDERKPIKISTELWNAIQRRQNADREATGVKPTQGDLMARAWAVFALSDSTVVNKDAKTLTLPTADLVPSLSELARKLSAAKAELDGIIARSTGSNDVSADTLVSEIRGKTRSGKALVDAVERSTGNAGKPKAG
jgi:hypothetical protein